jgi:DNA-binding response OmpR family regulator
VLVVEDDANLRLLCRVNLELESFDVREAATVDHARAEVARARPDVVFLDVFLGGRPTDDFLDELGSAGIPVVVVSGADTSQYRERASAVLGKPFAPADLVAAARRHTVS